MDTPNENSPGKSSSESLMLAEHERISGLYIHNASMAERRVNIHLVLLGAGIGLLGLPKLLERTSNPTTGSFTAFLPFQRDQLILALIIITFLLVEGILAFQRVIDRRIKALEYLRAINRINRYFADKDPELSRYLFWLPQDDVPTFQERAHGVADLRDLVAILSSLYFGAFLADVSMLLLTGGNLHSSPGWSATIISFGVGLTAALAAWLLHRWYERRTLARAELEASKKERFPSKEGPFQSVNPTLQRAAGTALEL